jgi:hypothetical protein
LTRFDLLGINIVIQIRRTNVDDWLKKNEEVKDYMSTIYGLFEGEGLEEAFKRWKKLPKDRKTEEELGRICKSVTEAHIDFSEGPPDWMPNV